MGAHCQELDEVGGRGIRGEKMVLIVSESGEDG
jgi:hypothetical protein